MKELEINHRKSVYDNLIKYDYFAKESDTIEVTEWTNGEGYDIIFGEKLVSLTYGQLNAINYLVDTLSYQNK